MYCIDQEEGMMEFRYLLYDHKKYENLTKLKLYIKKRGVIVREIILKCKNKSTDAGETMVFTSGHIPILDCGIKYYIKIISEEGDG